MSFRSRGRDWLALSALTLAVSAACSNPTEPDDPRSAEPEPFPDARPVRLWIYATGLTLPVADTVRLGFNVDEEPTSHAQYRCPPEVGWDCPPDLRSAWWSSDARVATVDETGLVSGVAPGEAVVWLQVESERDSARVRVLSNEGDAGARFARIEAGGVHACGLEEDGAAYCWGADNYGALGRGSVRWFTRTGAPGLVAGGHAFVHLAAGDGHTCGLLGNGQAWCWGQNTSGQVGNGQFDTNRPMPYIAGVAEPERVVGGLTFDTLVSAHETTCGLESGAAHCWGWNFRGELGIGSPDPQDHRPEPTQVIGGLTFRLLGAGGGHFCGVTDSDQVFCWGEHNRAVPSGPGRLSNEPVAVPGAPPFVSLVGGLGYSCGITAARETYCWGYNDRGQLGHGDPDGSETPTLVAGGLEFVSLAAGARHTCGLTAAGQAYCWGENQYGQLGDGTRNFVPNPEPRPVIGFNAFESLSAGVGHTCGVTTTGTSLCWGWLNSGQLGNGQVRHVSPPFGAGHPFWPSPQRVVAPMG